MTGSPFFKFVLVSCLILLGWIAPARGVGDPPDSPDSGDSDAKRFAVVIVNGRTLTGPNSSAHWRNGRILIPIVNVAKSLGDAVAIDTSARLVSVRRQNGSVATFDLRLGQVRENDLLILTISSAGPNAGDVFFSPNAEEFLLPVEIVSSLLDSAIRYDADKNAVIVSRGFGRQAPVASIRDRRPFEIHQIDYEYNLDHYSSVTLQSLTMKMAGRLADGRFTFLSNSISSRGNFSLRTGTFDLERPNGQRYIAGDFGTGANMQFLSATVRGGSASIPVGNMVVTAFGGRSYSGVFLPVTDPLLQPQQAPQTHQSQNKPVNSFRYDTNIFGFFTTTDSKSNGRGSNPFGFSAGAMRFNGLNRSGDLISGSINYDNSRFRLEGDLGYGKFTGQRLDGSRFSGYGVAFDLSGTFQVTDDFALQGRYTNIGKNFLSPQSGLREPLILKAAGFTWSPGKWFSTSLNASTARMPGDAAQNNAQNNKYVTAAFAINPPRPDLPRFYLSHTQSSTSHVRSSAFTLFTASKDFSRLRLFLNATRVQTLGPVTMNAQLGAGITINDKNALELSQGIGSFGALNGQFDWHASSLLNNRLNFSAGGGYNYTKTSGYDTFGRFSASVTLPRQTLLQVNYIQTNAGPTLLVSLRGTLFRKREGRMFLDSPVTEMNSYGKVSGRVYRDVDLDGKFDAGVDKPLADVKVRVDGNRYVVTDENGLYTFDSVTAGDHRVYLDLLSVRADLTFLDAESKNATILSGRNAVFDFRLVRTGRVSGRVWLDVNENSLLDDGEKPLADVRVVTASGRDTLTDIDGFFVIGDLPPGDHVILLDEKTLPEKTMAESRSQTVRTFPGRETGDILLPVIAVPAEVKRF